MPVIEVRSVSRSFGATKALAEVSFDVKEGEIFGLVGPDSAGKTTLLRVLCGLVAPDRGQVQLFGKDATRETEFIRPRIGYMAMPAGLYPDLSVAENIEFYAELFEVDPGRYRERMKRLLEFSGLGPFTDRLFRNLSGGMKQKAGLTCALIHSPRVLFLDEPTNGVDPVSRRDFWKILYELKREKVTIIVASTYLDEADRCHRVALLHQGRIRLLEEPMTMRRHIRGTLYNLAVSDRRAALKVLRAMPTARTPAMFGAGLHVTLQETGLQDVRSALHREGIEVKHMEPIEPALEDVYMTLLEDAEEAT